MISITLPSIYPGACHDALHSIQAHTKGTFEVLVVGPFDPGPGFGAGRLVHWIEDHDRKGCAAAHAKAADNADPASDFVVPFADDHCFVPEWDAIAIANWTRRAQVFYKRCELTKPFVLGLRGYHSGHVGTNFGIYYPYFPMMRRTDVFQYGWIGRDYAEGFGDSDLAMRVWAAGGRCEYSDQGLLYATAHDNRKRGDNLPEGRREAASFSDADLELFVDRWAGMYGKGWATKRIGDFNIDLRPEESGRLVGDHTVYRNEPGFMRDVSRIVS